jgi:hypothetical protein
MLSWKRAGGLRTKVSHKNAIIVDLIIGAFATKRETSDDLLVLHIEGHMTSHCSLSGTSAACDFLID